MHRLSFKIVTFLLLAYNLCGQSPHGKGFTMDCAKCHSADSWSLNKKNLKFDHNTTSFELKGQHDVIDCKACHTKLTFDNTPSECATCHADVHNNTAGKDCARCHTPKSWIVENATALHEQTSFPLNGVHKTVDCMACHKSETNIRFNPTGMVCVDCHNKDFRASKNPDHVKLNIDNDCNACHSTNTPDWAGAKFPDHNTFYPLTGAHAAIAQDCEKCHKGGNFTNTPTECNGCHSLDFNNTKNPNHAAIGISTDCASCHTNAPGWAPATFADHDSFFPITGGHKPIENNCAECHKGGDFSKISSDCNSCHNTDFAKASNPNHIKLGFTNDCASCHTTSPDWTPAIFKDHDSYFPLTGVHAQISCNECHKGGDYTNVTKDCNSCHNNDFKEAKNPNHLAAGFSTDCASCHNPTPNWAGAKFDHSFYPLTGGHQPVAENCVKCHTNNDYKTTPTDCNACHKTNFKESENPPHVSLGFSTDCASCHTTAPGWRPSTFDHNQFYPLTGAHAVVKNECSKCHSGGNFNKDARDCNSCHNTDFKATNNPNHAQMGMSTDCASCHTTNPGWRPSSFDHNKFYVLEGAHANIKNDCAKCHKGGDIKNTPNTCNGCHNSNFTNSVNPNHVAADFSTDCASCHTTVSGWRPANFSHDFYPLTGGHAAVASNCVKCHTSNNYKTTPTDCYSCHNSNFKAAANPNHQSLAFSTDCASCHSTSPGWRPSSFDHNKFYVLEGAHTNIKNDCAKCHKGGDIKNTPNTCNGCHNSNFTNSVNPNHVAAGFSTDCASCHTTAPGWRPTNFSHDFYPLTGGHAAVASNCVKCHTSNNYKTTPTDCNSCHNANFKAAANPNHAGLGFSTDCTSCHSTNPGWRPSSFDHNKFYVLEGAHAKIKNDCAKCHKGGDIKNTPNTCNGCHYSNFTNSVNPNHVAAGFSTDCASCHTTNAGWRPTNFSHDFYPLTGGHAAVASNCVKCHTSNNYETTPTDCNSCHNANFKAAANPNHAGLGFSTDCASCHTTNPGWRPSSFDHNKFYVLEGAHANIKNDCAKCHKGGDIKNTPNTCNGCHNSNFTNSVNPNHVAAGFSTDCATCHSTNAGWSPTTFSHDFYPLTGGHAAVASNCVKCHTSNNYKTTPTDCNSCHNATYKATTNPNHVAGGFGTDCATCHTTNPGWRPSTFDHNKFYVLTGAHVNIKNECSKCHKGGNFNNTPNTCNGCHNSNFTNAVNPNHVAAGFSIDCASCHTTNAGWRPTIFSHDFYPLTGGHAAVASNCVKCHTSNNYKTTPTDCNSCHNANFKAAMNPNHAGLGFSTDCASCHSTAPEWRPSSFDHNKFYVLEGAHANIKNDCAKCHKGGDIKNTPNTCNGCHNSNFTNSVNPNHVAAGFSTDCASCHSTNVGWKPTTFSHDFYPLTGGHAAVASNCVKCHTSNNYKTTPTDCNSCHNANFKAAVNPNHAGLGFSTDCASCHSTNPGWRPSSFDHNKFYMLEGAHANIKNDCAKCHKGGDIKNTPNTCNGCHNSNFTNSVNPNHVAAGFSTDCASCHTTAPGWRPANFSHDFYPLTGGHAAVASNCVKCHTSNNYKTTPTDCNSCHNANFKAAANPNHAGLGFSTDCASCHSTAPGWRPSSFDHNKFYVLEGAHANIKNDCAKCHKGGDIKNTPNTCNGCHNSNFTNSVNPNHVAAGFSTDCASCHTTAPGWRPANFSHDFYPLTGGHAAVASNCIKCHTSNNYKTTPTDCNSCHNANFKAATNPNHQSLGFSTDCASCHTTNPGWRPSSFDHNKFYVLERAHANIKNDCAKCHKGGDIKNTPNTCNSCHNSNFTNSVNPNHVAAGFSTDCASCHTTAPGWRPANFSHDFYPLTGGHAAVASNCVKCHTSNNYKTTPTDCNSCHNANFKAAVNPNHAGLGFSTDCASCHTTNPGWRPSSFDHNKFYVLEGAHANIKNDCAKCHKGGDIKNTPNTCNGCHNSSFTNSVNPNHVAAGFSTDCASCHTTAPGWRPANFSHDFYPLTGGHAAVASNCVKCHTSNNYKTTPTDCNSCHNATYKATTNPNHVAGGFGTDCASCHTTAPGWRPSTFDHNKFYVLTGAHVNIKNECSKCHVGGNFNNTPNTCNGCHNGNYNNSVNPNHKALGLSTDCASCHTTNPGWRPSTFNHNTTSYPLTGAHANIASNCASCHKTGNISTAPTDCNSCHNSNYNATANPNHVAGGFGTDCARCHTTNPGWRPATFDHNQFYVLSGAHANIKNECSKCHIGGKFTGTPNTCNGCHNGNFNASVNPNHKALGISTDCASCHTTNPGWRPSTFNHNNTSFQLTGAHANIASNCASCHKTGNISTAPTDCNLCHNGAYTGATNPNHVAGGFGTDCARCHTTNPGWRPATFDHNQFYVLNGAHANIKNECSKCHAGGNFSNTPNTCNGCHNGAYNSAANPNHKNLGISNECVVCHTTNPGWRPSTFNHNAIYPLVGAHANIANNCAACHTGGNISNAPNTCIGCHQTDYNTASPNHVASHFPTSCTDCHSQNAWKPANWNHDATYFPIYSGKHKGKWSNNCNNCHTNAGNYAEFNCMNCHTKNETDKDHKDVKNYEANNIKCLECHPRGD